MTLQPTQIELATPEQLRITWSDAVQQTVPVTRLRERCPCASCREKRNAPTADDELLPVLSAAELQPTRIVQMRPIGNYAYGIHFSDGHDTGIFTLEFLRQLGDE